MSSSTMCVNTVGSLYPDVNETQYQRYFGIYSGINFLYSIHLPDHT
jgi:sorbitol-specific phosphotransferase system component IIC